MSSEVVWMTVKEYAALFRQHPHSVYRRIRQGTFRFQVERDGRTIWVWVPEEIVNRLRKSPAA